MSKLGIYEYAHMIHRAWRYRLNTERDEIRFLLSLDLAGKTILDIGANTGIYSYWMCKKAGLGGRVVGFEPQPEMIEHLEKIKSGFHLRQLEIAPTGLSSTSGEVTLNREMNHLGGASISFDLPNADNSITIPLSTLDDYCSEHKIESVAFIKCDVEGHEAEVVEGGMGVLTRDRPALLIECHDELASESRMFDQLAALGYRAHFFYRRNLVPLSKWDDVRDQIDKVFLNYVFLPPTDH